MKNHALILLPVLFLLTISCNDENDITLPLSLSLRENIPTFFFLEESGINYYENHAQVREYCEKIEEYFGTIDTVDGADYRWPEDAECHFRVSMGDIQDKRSYCFPREHGAKLVLFENGDVGMVHHDQVIVVKE